jgi:hypothetical protein
LIIQDLETYVTYANSLISKGELNYENRGTFELGENHPFSHFKNIKSRLKRLRQLLIYSKGLLKSEQMLKIWEIVIE